MKLLPCLLLIATTLAQAAGAPQTELLRQLSQPAVLRGSFVQQRQIAGFRRPVQSAGRFVVAHGTGLLWHTQRPFESLLVINRQMLSVSNGVGQSSTTTLDAAKEPMLRMLNDLLQGVVVADLAQLQAQFDVDVRPSGATDWAMTLLPRQAALRSRFTSIDLVGGKYVRSVQLHEQSGDVTIVRFADQMEDDHLTDVEAGQLR
jgi:outer membrane lipoprotein-sorting protein